MHRTGFNEQAYAKRVFTVIGAVIAIICFHRIFNPSLNG
jgi:hypothetical protein